MSHMSSHMNESGQPHINTSCHICALALDMLKCPNRHTSMSHSHMNAPPHTRALAVDLLYHLCHTQHSNNSFHKYQRVHTSASHVTHTNVMSLTHTCWFSAPLCHSHTSKIMCSSSTSLPTRTCPSSTSHVTHHVTHE